MLHLKYTREKFNFEISIPRQFLSIEKYGPFISFQLSWNVSQPNQRDRSLFCNFLFEFKTIFPLDGSIWTFFGRFLHKLGIDLTGNSTSSSLDVLAQGRPEDGPGEDCPEDAWTRR